MCSGAEAAAAAAQCGELEGVRQALDGVLGPGGRGDVAEELVDRVMHLAAQQVRMSRLGMGRGCGGEVGWECEVWGP